MKALVFLLLAACAPAPAPIACEPEPLPVPIYDVVCGRALECGLVTQQHLFVCNACVDFHFMMMREFSPDLEERARQLAPLAPCESIKNVATEEGVADCLEYHIAKLGEP